MLCKEMGCGMLYTEMVSAKAILYQNKNTEGLMKVTEGENPIALQLFGSDPQVMAEIAKRIEERPFDTIDVNMGCPVPKVVNNGEGSALMKDPVLVGKIGIRRCSSSGTWKNQRAVLFRQGRLECDTACERSSNDSCYWKRRYSHRRRCNQNV